MSNKILHPSKRKQKGYSLIELAIVMTVLGLVTSGLIYPVGARIQDNVKVEVKAQLSDAVEAVIGYAISNRSPGALFNIFHRSWDHGCCYPLPLSGHRTIPVEANRPYLPCPDIDGDGVEDRTVLHAPVNTYPLIDSVSPQGQLFTTRHQYREFFPQLRQVVGDPVRRVHGSNTSMSQYHKGRYNRLGECARNYGNLPWKTLAISPSDPWGNHFSYYVHDHFSTGIFGFDQLTRASMINELVEIDIKLKHTDAAGYNPGVFVRNNLGRPVLVCHPDVIDTTPNREEICQPDTDFDTSSYSRFMRYDISSAAFVHPFAYSGTRRNYDITYRRLTRYAFDMVNHRQMSTGTEGVPFLIISHGPNRFGGVPASSGRPTSSDPDGGTPCFYPYAEWYRIPSIQVLYRPQAIHNSKVVTPIASTALNTRKNLFDHPEAINTSFSNCSIFTEIPNLSAFMNLDSPVRSIYFNSLVNPADRNDRETSYTHLFVYAKERANGPVNEYHPLKFSSAQPTPKLTTFDDSVAWLTRAELAVRMFEIGIFPIPEPFRGFLQNDPDYLDQSYPSHNSQ